MASGDLQGSDLLTFGEAAEYAGVSLLDLRERLRLAQVPAVWGWRAGAAVHLVPLKSLHATFPGLIGKARTRGPSLAERGIEVLPESKPQAAAESVQVHEPLVEKPTLVDPRAPDAPAENPTSPLLEKLYEEIEEAAAHNAKLMDELTEAGTGLNKLLGEIQLREQSASKPTPIILPDESKSVGQDKIEQWKQLEAEQQELENARRRGQHTSWGVTAILAAILVVGFSLKSKDILLASTDPDPASDLPGLDPERNHPADGLFPSDENLAGNAAAQDPMTVWEADERESRMSSGTGLLSFAEALGVHTVEVEPAVITLKDIPAPASPAEEPAVMQAESQVLRNPVPSITATPIAPETNRATVIEQDLAPLVLSHEPACLYSKLTAPGQELRGVLGPCIGPWNPEIHSVAGGFRHLGERYCRHHLIVAKDLGGSVDRARNVATYAKAEGLLPPLVRLRVEHGASDLLQKRIGKWVESGFEAGLSGQHEVTAGPGQDLWVIKSWVRLQSEPGAQAKLQHFTMELQLAADKARDRWISFAWASEE
ncbi:MAG: hypothetical protein ACI9X4_002431 [Glaciecola sp.]|jgi:hypothetical protein